MKQMKTILQTRTQTITFPRRPLIMGILNITNDSLCNDGRIDQEWAANQAHLLTSAGADIIDVGAESARTNRLPISEKEELDRLIPFVSNFYRIVADSHPRDEQQLFPPLLSINTWRPNVARKILAYGGDILNDIGGLPTAANAYACFETGVALLIMHTVGEPKQNHSHLRHSNILETLEQFYSEKLVIAQSTGLSIESIILDPGIGFAKQPENDLKIFANLHQLAHFNRPLLMPISRKGVIEHILQLPDPTSRDAGTIACLTASVLRGAHILRVHNVNAAYLAVKTLFTIEACGVHNAK